MPNLFETLIADIKKHECILFVGSGVSRELGLPSAEQIKNALALDLGLAPYGTLAQIAQTYETRWGRARLVGKISEMIQSAQVRSGVNSYDLIAGIAELNHPIYTTNWDNRLEQAFTHKNKPFHVIRSAAQLATIGQPHAIIKLHGDLDGDPREMIVTQDDYTHIETRATQLASLFAQLGVLLATKSVLFIGYSLEDEDWRLLYHQVSTLMPTGKQHYAVMLNPSKTVQEDWERKGITILHSSAFDLLKKIFIATRRFINREHEREYICERAEKPYIEVTGSVASGKTELLGQVIESYKLKGIWRTALVPCGACNTPLNTLVEIARQAIGQTPNLEQLRFEARQTWAQQTSKPATQMPSAELEARTLELATRQFIAQLGNQRLIVAFDCSESISATVLDWLEDTWIPVLENNAANLLSQVRLVFAGTAPLPWTSPRIKRNLKQFTLSGFDEAAVVDMLNYHVELKQSTPLPPVQHQDIARGILHLSSGHPDAIRRLIEEIAGRDVWVTGRYFDHNGRHAFTGCVLPVAQRMLERLPDELRSVLTRICIFRQIIPEFFQTLADKKQIDRALLPAIKLMGVLQATHLFSQPEPMYRIDPVVRRMLAMAYQFQTPSKYKQMHALALELYTSWSKSSARNGRIRRTYPGADLVIAFMQEALFHRTALLALKHRTQTQNARLLQTQLESDLLALNRTKLTPFERDRIGKQLRHKLQQDQELLDKVAAFVGNTAYTMFDTIVTRWMNT